MTTEVITDVMPFVPLTLVMFSTVIFAARHIFGRKPPPVQIMNSALTAPLPDFNPHADLIKTWGKTYENSTVDLDGREFVNCTFSNVTFRYQGLKPFRLTSSNYPNDAPKITTSNPCVYHTLVLARDTEELNNPQCFTMSGAE